MADCKKCDRCGSYYDESDTFKKDIPKISKEKVNGIAFILSLRLGCNKMDFGKIDLKAKDGSWVGPIDFCPNCGEEFYKWLMNEEANNGKQGTEKTKKKT
jgi:hypothetical protein